MAVTVQQVEKEAMHEKVHERTLQEMDKVGFNWITFKTVMVAGVGFMADQYNLFAVSLVKPILTSIYPYGNSAQASAILGASGTLGTMLGQLIFGYLGDKVFSQFPFFNSNLSF